jgi:endo-1,4-beta-xylanase
VREDGSRKPSYGALESLIKAEWWLPPTEMRTGPDGTLAVRGFLGDYTVAGAEFAICSGSSTLTVRLDG